MNNPIIGRRIIQRNHIVAIIYPAVISLFGSFESHFSLNSPIEIKEKVKMQVPIRALNIARNQKSRDNSFAGVKLYDWIINSLNC